MNYENDEIVNNTKYESLYDTVSRIYYTKKPISRLLYITKMKEKLSDNLKVEREKTLSNIRDEIKRLLGKSDEPSNLMIFYISTLYAFVGIENSNDNLMNYLYSLHIEIKNKTSFHETVNIIAFVEESPVSFFPAWYKYEGSVYDMESQQYKDKAITEKGFVLYEQLFCNLGKCIKPLIQTEQDFIKNENRIKKEEEIYTKFIPSMDEINEFTGPDFVNLDTFVKMYIDMMDIELDEDRIWPYQWPFNI